MNIFIICSVRNAPEEYTKKISEYVELLERKRYKIHFPPRDTGQNARGIDICKQNRQAIKNADEVHVFYTPESQGTHFDMGMAFAFNKQIKVIENIEYGLGKSYPRMLDEWQADH